MYKEKMLMGMTIENNPNKTVKLITFSVTEDCNLICKYCYLTGKNSKNHMSFETAKKVIDYILSDREYFNEELLSLEFIGGEPLLEIILIDKICDYFISKVKELKHHWADNYRFNIATNGILYGTKKVQDFIKKNIDHLSIVISVDGNKAKHDLQRIKPDGNGSYDDILENIRLWRQQFPNETTKATFSHDDLVYLKDSIISLWEFDIKNVMVNIVFEDVWQEGDDLIFEKQLIDLADYIIDNKLWKDHNVKFFDNKIGFPLIDSEKHANFCGTGKMMAVDTKGRFFPCIRFLDFSLNNKKSLCIGDYERGIDIDKLRPFDNLSLRSQSTKECLDCEVGSGCAWCSGSNYDYAETDTLFQRMTFLCKMQKANVRACNYFWDKLREVTNEDTPRNEYKKSRLKQENNTNVDTKYLLIITSDNITPHCNYRNTKKTDNVMTDEILNKGLEFADKNRLTPIFLGSPWINITDSIKITGLIDKSLKENDIIIYDNKIENKQSSDNCILLLSRENITKLTDFVKGLHPENFRINVILEDDKQWTKNDMEEYRVQLEFLSDLIIETYEKGKPMNINILTDMLNLKSMCNCNAGVDSYSLAPNGKFYICPAFYFENPDDDIGDFENGIKIKNEYLFDINRVECCMICDAYHCKRCKYENKKYTGEIHIPSKNQCMISHIERNVSQVLQQRLIDKKYMNPIHRIPIIDYMDPNDLIKKGIRKNF